MSDASWRVGLGPWQLTVDGDRVYGRGVAPGGLAWAGWVYPRTGVEAAAAYPGLKAATGPIAAAYYEEPSAQIDVLAGNQSFMIDNLTGIIGHIQSGAVRALAVTSKDRNSPPTPCGCSMVKKVEAAIEAGDKAEAATALQAAQPEMARGIATGVLHKNTVARKFSRLTKRVAALA